MPVNKITPRKQNVNVNSRWLQNTLRSLGISATSAFSDLMPATAGTISTGTRLATDIGRTIRSNRTGSKLVQDAIKNNQLVKIGQDFFKNAISDIRSGEWNDHMDRGSMGDMMGDMDTMFGDMDSMFGDESIPDDGGTDVVVNNINSGNDASIRAIEKSTEYNVRAAKATVDTMVALGSTSMIRMEELGNKAINELTNINSTLTALLEYQNTNMTRFIEASIGYYEQMSSPADDSSGGSTIKAENLYSDKGLDFNTYKDYVIQNIKKIKDEDGTVSMVSMLVENLPDMLANPMELATKTLVKRIIPEVTKNAMTAMDQSMQNFIPYLLERIGYLGEGQTGMMGTAMQYIGKVFGTRTTAKKDLDFSNIKTGPVPYNGKANHTITEIIPKYLRESNNYLRIIAEHFTGQTAEQMDKSAMGFNWSTGRFQSMQNMQKSMQDDYIIQVLGNLTTSDFGKKFLSTAQSVLENENERNGMENILQQIMVNSMQSGKRFNFGDENQISEIVNGLSGTENQKRFVSEFLAQMKEQNDVVLGNLENQRINAIRRSNNYIRGMNENGGTDNNTYQLYAGRENEDILRDINEHLRSNSPTNPTGTNNATAGPAPQEQSNEAIRNAIRISQVSDTTNQGGAGGAAARPFRLFSNLMNSIMAGNSDAAWDAFINGIGDSFRRAGSFLSQHFLTPIKNALFGERNQDGYINGGIFAGINNRMKESFYGLRRMITGKGYVDAEGNTVPDANDEEMENTVVGKLKSSVNWLKDAIATRLFGEKNSDGTYAVDDEGNEKDGILGKTKRGLAGAASSLMNGLVRWKKALFGDKENEEEDGKAILQQIKDKAEEVAPTAIAGGIGGGLLGFLVGGPIGGAMLGFAGGIASKSDRFKKWLFGDDDSEGVISKNVQDYVKKNGKFLAGGAATGMVSGLITGGGLLGSIVGGPLAGALMGVGTSMLLKSDMFQKFMFGDPEKGQLGLKQHVGRWMKKLGMNSGTGEASGGKLAGMAGVGAIGGGLIGMMLGGPVLGALGGLGLSILAQKDNFHEWLFGSVDEKTGAKKEGVLGQFKNMLVANVFTPVGNSIKNIGDDFKTFFKYRILGQFNLIVERVGDSFFGAVSRITGTAMASIGDFGSYIKENFLKKFIEGVGNILAPLTSAATKVAEGIYSVGKAIVAAPLNIMTTVLGPAVSAVTGVIGTVGSAMVKTVNTVLIKPVNALIIKPLGAAISLAGKVIAAPFKMVASAFNWINNTLVAGLGHITRFASAVADHVKQQFTEKIIDPIKKGVTETFVKVKDFILRPINIVADFAKDVFVSVGTYAKQKISGFFSQALHMMNPLTWIKGMAKLGSNALNIISGGRIGNGPKEKPEGSGTGGGWLGQLWRDTKTGTGKDYSSRMIYDNEGNLVDTKMSWSERRKALREEEAAENANNKAKKAERRNTQKNQQLIRKYTKGQRLEDTEENRQLAEAAVGHKLDWGKVGPKKSEFEKLSENYYDETVDLQTQIKNYMKDVAKFLLGGNFRAYGSDTKEGAAAAARTAGARMQSARDKRQEVITNAKLDESYHAKRDARDAQVVDKRVTRREDKQHREQVVEDVTNNGVGSGIRNAWSFMMGRLKGDIPANADGTDEAEPGFSIVGEKGPEVVYGKNAKFGKFVGLGGPEVIRMKGGETVIPNHRLPKYEDGVGDNTNVEIASVKPKTDDAISRVTDTTKLSMSERILRKLSEIKSSIVGALTGGGPSGPSPIQSIMSGEEPEAAESLPGASIAGVDTFGGDGSDNNMINDGKENSTLDQRAAQDLVSGKTGALMRITRAAEKEEAEDDARENAKLAALQDLQTETKEHNSVWDSIFSKKGLITAGLIAAIPLLLKFLNSDFINTLGNMLKDFIGNTVDQFNWTNEHDARENGETMGERAMAMGERALSLGIFDENGNADHISYPAGKLLARGIFNKRGIISGGVKLATAAGKGIANLGKTAAGDIAKAFGNTKALADLGLEYGDEAWDLADNVVQKTGAKVYNAVRTSSAANVVKNAASTVSSKVATVTEPLKTVTAEGSKLFKQVGDMITSFFDDILKKFSSKTGIKATSSILAKIKPSNIMNALKSQWDELVEKIVAVLGGRVGATAVSAGLAEAVFVGIAAINGLSGTAKLFHVRSEDVDGKMRIISTLFGGLLGTTPGAIIDLVSSVFYDITGIDLLSSLATTLYNFWAGEEDAADLSAAQDEFQADYDSYQNAEINKQYETQKAAGLIDADMTSEQFAELAHAGEIGIDYDSFANYNADVNASLGDKAMGLLSSAGKGIAKGWNWLTGKDETVYRDADGNTYKKNDDGTYQVTSATGEDLGYVAEDALSQKEMTEETIQNDNIFQKAGKGLASAGSAIVNGAKSLGSTVVVGLKSGASAVMDAGKAVGEAVANKWNALKDGVKWLTSRETATGYYDVDGSYYLTNGEHYTANGELIETVDLADLSALIVSGQLSEPTEIVTKDFGFITAAKDGLAKIQEGFKTAGENLKKFGDSVKQKASELGTKITTAFSNAKTSVVNFFTAHSEKVWFDTDGSYWKAEGNQAVHYNTTGDKIGDPISADELSSLIASGGLTEGEIQVDSGIKQGIKSLGEAITSGWQKFTTAASNFGNSLKEKAGAALQKAGEFIGGATTKVKNFLMSHTEKRYFDTDGGYYQTNGNTFDYYNQNGDLITEGITTDEFAELLKSGTVTEGNVQEVTVNSGIRTWFDDMASRGKEAFTKWKDNAAELWSSVGEKAGSAIKAISDAGGPIAFIGGLFTTKKETAWFDTNGNYYKLESNGKYSKYNMNGDVLEEDIDAEKVQELANAGLLTEGEVEVDTAAQEAVKQIKDAVASAWDAAKNTVKSGWESFKNWITGGSGTNASVVNNYRPETEGYIPGGSGFGVNSSTFVRGGRGESQPTTMNGIPYYSQNDSRWASNKYEPLNKDDGATMANTGCGPTAMSMVIGGMTGDKPLPTELASYAQFTGTRDETGTNWNFIDSAASTYGLNSTRSIMPSTDFIANNLSSGNPMVLSGQSDNSGPYTRAGHYIVATGIDSNGNVSYNDPRGASYSGRMNIKDFINNTGAAWSFNVDKPFGASGTGSRRNNVFYKNKFIKGGRGTGVMAADVVAVAKNEVGYVAKKSNSQLDSKTANAIGAGQYNGYTKYSRDTFPEKNKYAWCAMFVCWVFKTAANGDVNKAKELLCGSGYSAGCVYIKNAFSAKGQLLSKSATPIPGDIVLFNWNGGSTPQHVGIVIGTNGDKVVTVEGNTSAKSQSYGGCVEMKERSRSDIVCFGRPIYDDTSAFQGITVDGEAVLGDSSSVSNSYTSIVSQYTSMFGNLANAAFDAALTGNTDIDWTSVFSNTDSSSSTSSSGSLTTSGVVDPGDINERTRKVIQFFRSKGLTDAQIAGILGCWKAESGVTPGKVEGYYLKGYPSGMNYAVDRNTVDNFTQNTLFPAYANSGISINKNAYKGSDGHYYPGVGLAQWTGPRGQTYANLFTKNGYKFGQIEPELELVWDELSPGGVRSYALSSLKQATTPDAATDAFCRKYEGYSGADGIRTRQNYARQFYNSMGDIMAGGSGDGLSIAQHKYLIDEDDSLGSDTHPDTSGEIKPIKSSININQVSRAGYGVGRILRGGSGTPYDDTLIVGLLNQVVGYLGSISTNTKQLDLLKDIKDLGGNTVNLTEIRGGTNVNATNNVKNNTRQKPITSTEMSRSEMTARRIAGISV